jgi:hypothetical protein
LQEEHGSFAAAELHALVDAGEKAVAPEARVERLVDALLADEHDEPGQVLIDAPEPVTEPRPHARPPGELVAGLEKRDRRVVVDRLGVERFDEAQLVHHLRGPRHQLADGRLAFSVLRELEDRPGERQRRLVARHAGQPLPHANARRQILAVALVEQRLVVKQIMLRGPAGHEEVDDALGARREVGLVEDAFKRVRSDRCGGRRCCERIAMEKAHQRDAAETEAEAAEKVAAVHRVVDVVAELGHGDTCFY